jgi:hypothetical protein
MKNPLKKSLALFCFVLVALLFTFEDAYADRIKLNATYTVPPTLDTQDPAYNQFTITDYEVDTAQVEHESMRFVLPLDLTAGNNIEIKMQVVNRVEKTRTLQGELGEATCQGPWVAMSCRFKFRGLPKVDSTSYLQNKYGEQESVPFAKVAQAFGNDPIGTGVLRPADRKFVGNGVWEVRPSSFTDHLPATLELVNDRGILFWGKGRMHINSLTYEGILAEGTLQKGDQSGKLRLEFSQDQIKGNLLINGSPELIILRGRRSR